MVQKKNYLTTSNHTIILKEITLELTERCNNHCIHCYINQPDTLRIASEELTANEVKDILTEAFILGCDSVVLTGGEPLLHRGFYEILNFACQLGLFVQIKTNGRLIGTRFIDAVKDRQEQIRIQISAYGWQKKSYESITRVPGSFQEFKMGISKLLENHIPFYCMPVMFRSSQQEYKDFVKWQRENTPVTDVQVDNLNPIPNFSLRVRHDLPQKNQQIMALRALSPIDFGIDIYTKIFLDDLVYLIKRSIRTIENDGYLLCGCGKESISIDSYGIITGCLFLRSSDLSFDHSTYSIQAAIKKFAEARDRRVENELYLKHCAKCFLRSYCPSCPGQSWCEYQETHRPVEAFCQDSVNIARRIGLLSKDEQPWNVSDIEKRLEVLQKKIDNFSQTGRFPFQDAL